MKIVQKIENPQDWITFLKNNKHNNSYNYSTNLQSGRGLGNIFGSFQRYLIPVDKEICKIISDSEPNKEKLDVKFIAPEQQAVEQAKEELKKEDPITQKTENKIKKEVKNKQIGRGKLSFQTRTKKPIKTATKRKYIKKNIKSKTKQTKKLKTQF